MALTFLGRVRDNISSVQRKEVKRGWEGVSELSCDALWASNGHVNYPSEIIISSIPSYCFPLL